MQDRRRSNPERSAATRTRLLAAARRLFVERGYGATGTPEIVARAGITRGALYHHFKDKQDLFRAVVEAESRAVAGDIEAAGPPDHSALDALLAGSDAFLAAMAVPGRTRLLLVDAPAILGPEAADAIDRQNARRTLHEGLAAAMEDGTIRALPLDALAVQLSATFDRAALAIASGADAGPHRQVIAALIEGLRSR